MSENVHAKKLKDILENLETSEDGLSRDEVLKKQKKYGLNELPEEDQKPFWKMVFEQINSPLIYVLIITALFSYAIGKNAETIVILAVIVINLSIGIYHEIKAQRIISNLKSLATPKCLVRREGQTQEIDLEELVPGDIVLLKDGNRVPADIRVTKAYNVNAIEAALTGESVPVSKKNTTLPEETQLGDRINMFFMGTIVGSGEAEGVVVRTGTQTEIGSIATTLRDIEKEKSLFAKRTAKLTKSIAIVIVCAALIVFSIGLIRGIPLEEIILFTIASFVAGIPEGLPAVLTVALSVAAYKLAKRNSVVRNLSSVEILSSVTTIVTDKTGTLTQNSMTVTKILLGDKRLFQVSGKTWEPKGDIYFKKKKIGPKGDNYFKFLFPFLAVVNKVELKEQDGKHTIYGDPTEGSRLVLAEKAGFNKKECLENYEILDDMPYDQEKKYRGMIIKDKKGGKTYAIIIGGAENILSTCKYTKISPEKTKNISEYMSKYNKTIKGWTKEAMRLQGVAYTELKKGETKFSKIKIKSMTFLAMLGVHDPIRDDVPQAIKKAQDTGIRVIMATGDNKETAKAIGKKVGIKNPDNDHPYALEEIDLQNMNEKEFKEAVKNVPIFARVIPKTKYKIAKILQEEGEIIAMTGDGVNDSLALKKANMGISMGVIGTDAAREASDLVLMDDNFATIINAIEEGLTVFKNLRQTTIYLLSTNLGEYGFIILSMILGVPLPLLPIQILWLNLLTDGLLDVALATEKTNKDTWEMGIRDQNEDIIDKKQRFTLTITIMTIAFFGLSIFLYFLPEGVDKARTATFLSLTFGAIFFSFSMRSPNLSIFSLGFFTNKFLFISIIIIIVLTTMLIEIPFLADLFSFEILRWYEILTIAIFSTIPFWIVEGYKALKRYGKLPKY